MTDAADRLAILISQQSGGDAGARIRLIPFNEISLGTDRRDLVKGLIPRCGLTVVWGPPKSGKSFWLFDLVMHVALGWPYRGRRVHAGPVVYCAFEGQTGLKARVEAFRQSRLAEEPDPVPFYLQPVTLDLVADHAALIAAIKDTIETPPVLVVLDTLNRSLNGSESSDADMTAYIRAADAIREAFDCAVIIVHHCGIDGSRPRGHTALTGAADVQISVKRDTKDNIVATVELAKDGPQGETMLNRLDVVEVGFDDDNEPITSCVVVQVEGQAVHGAPHVTGAAKVALDLLCKAIDEEGQPALGGSHYPPGSRTIPVSTWRSHYIAGTMGGGQNPDSKRRAFDRAASRLQSLGHVGFWANLVWINEPRRTART